MLCLMDLPIVAPQEGAFSNREITLREEHWGLCGVQPEGNDAAAWKAMAGTTGKPARAVGGPSRLRAALEPELPKLPPV